MPSTMKRSRSTRGAATRERARLNGERRELRALVRREREVRRLARALEREITRGRDALVGLTRFLLRELPVGSMASPADVAGELRRMRERAETPVEPV